jgi:hypothetical protein
MKAENRQGSGGVEDDLFGGDLSTERVVRGEFDGTDFDEVGGVEKIDSQRRILATDVEDVFYALDLANRSGVRAEASAFVDSLSAA